MGGTGVSPVSLCFAPNNLDSTPRALFLWIFLRAFDRLPPLGRIHFPISQEANVDKQNRTRNSIFLESEQNLAIETKSGLSRSEPVDRRAFLKGVVAGATVLALPSFALAAERDLDVIHAEIKKRHAEALQRLQAWIRQPSIAAENKGVTEGCELTMRLLRDAGFGQVTKVPTDGQPGIFATLDAGAPRTLGLYFMYDVKQVDPAEWSSPPWDAALVDKPGLGKVVVGRGAVNQKGPEASFLAALHAMGPMEFEPGEQELIAAELEELDRISKGAMP